MNQMEAWSRLNVLTAGGMTEAAASEAIALVDFLQGGTGGDVYFWRTLPVLRESLARFQALVDRARTLGGHERTQAKKQAGYAFEEVAAALFGGLRGWNRFRSYQSGTLQHDVLMYGDSPVWTAICRRLQMPPDRNRLLVEVKATDDPISAATFARFCEAINSMQRVGLGIFLSLDGIADFPRDGLPGHSRTGAHLQQAIYYARTNVPVIGLDAADVASLASTTNLISLLKARIDALVDLGRPTMNVAPLPYIEGPPHVQAVLAGLGGVEVAVEHDVEHDP